MTEAETETESSPEPSPGPWSGRIERMRPWLAWSFAIFPLVWAAIRLSGLGAGSRLEVLMVFTPYAAVASTFCVIGALLLRHRLAAAVAVVACLGFLPVLASQFSAGPNAAPEPTGEPLRVMTLNVKYGEADPAEVVALVEAHQVDVLGLQEITPELAESLEEAGLHALLDHQALQPRSGASGMALYANLPFEEVDLGVTDEVDPITGRFLLGPDQAVEITVVHPLPPLGSWRSSWLEALDQLAEVEVGGAEDPIRLIIGDFNATLDQPTLRSVIDAGYHDAASAVGRGWVPTWGPGAVPLLAIDHVLVDRSVHVEEVEIHSVTGSDHRAVIATIRPPGPTR